MRTPICHALIVILICLFLPKRIYAEKTGDKATVGEFLKQQIEGIDNATNPVTIQDIVRIHQPPSSIKCNRTDLTKLKVIKNTGGLLYLLSKNELLSFEVDTANEPRYEFIGTLQKFDSAALDIQIEMWLDLMVIVVQQGRSLSVYIASAASQGSDIEPIQTLTTNSLADRFILSNNGKDLSLVTYGIKKGGANELMYFKWKSSFFSKESEELVDIPNESKIFAYRENTSEPLIFAIGVSNETTRIVSLKLNVETNKWTKLQSLHFKQGYIDHYVVRDQLYLIGCSTDAFCAIYKWKNNMFQRYRKITSQVFERIKSVYYQQNIVVVESSKGNLAFFTSDNIVSHQPEFLMAKQPKVADYAIFKSQSNNVYFVEFLLEKMLLVVNFYKISIERNEQESIERLEAKQPNPLECVSMLKSQLKHRMPTVQILQQEIQLFKNPENQLQMEGKKYLRAQSSNLKNTKIRRLTMDSQLKSSALDLQKKAIETNINVELTRRLLKKPQSPPQRSQARAGEEEIEEMDNIVVDELIHNENDPLFTDILLKSQLLSTPSFTLNDDIRLRNITAKKIVVLSDKINNIEISKLINSTKSKRVPGSKKVKVLQVKQLTFTNTLNDLPQSVFDSLSSSQPLDLSGGFENDGDLNVKNLVVKAFNGFDIEKLLSSMFLIGGKNEISGSLTFRNVTNVGQLIANSLMNLPVESFLTTSTDQIVIADLFINKFHVNKLTTNTINDEPLAQNVALANGVNDIEVPSQFLTLHVLRDLNIREDSSNTLEGQRTLSKTIEIFKRHIIGTQASDLSQIYSGQVLIQGSLNIIDVTLLFPKQTKMIVNDQEVPHNISLNFWMKTARQRIQTEKFTIANQAVKTGHLITQFIASHPTKEHILLDVSSQGLCNLRFEKALVKSDVKGHKNNVPSMLFHLNQTAIFRQEPVVFVQGSIAFRDKLTVRNLGTIFINDRSSNEFVNNNQQQIKIEGTKTVKDLQVDQLLIKTGLTVDTFNNVALQKLQDEAIKISQPIELDVLKVSRFEASTLAIEFFEDHLFNEFIESLDKQLQPNGTSESLRNVRIIGDVNFASKLSLNTINDKTSFDGLVNLLVMKNDPSFGIGGKKTFAANLVTENLVTNLINDFSANRLFYESLARNERQTLSGEFFVKNLTTKSIRSKTFNKIPLGQFVDKTFAHLPLNVNLKVKELHVRALLSGSASFDIRKLIEYVQFPTRKNWNIISVESAIEIPMHQTSYLDQIVMLAVYKVGPPQVITGKVQTISNRVFVKTMSKTDGIINASQDLVNVNILFTDSLKRRVESAVVVKGIKTFLAPLYVNNLRIGANAYYESKEINNEDVLALNHTIVRPHTIIEHEKVMKSLHAEEIELNGKINGIRPSSLVSVTNNAVQLPRLSLYHLELLSLNTYTLYDFSMLHFLQNRMRKFDGPEQETNGFLIFTSLDLVNDAIMSSINRVSIDDAIFLRSDHLQDVSGHKYVMGNITMIGPSIIKTINSVDFIDFVGNSLTRHKVHKADVMELPAAELKKGLVVKQLINGYNTEELLTSDAHVPKLNDLVSLVTQVQNQINDLKTDERIKETKPKRLIYIDYDPEVKISFESPTDLLREASDSHCAENTIEPDRYKSVIVREKRGSEMFVNVSSASFKVTPNFRCRSDNIFSKELSVWWTYNHDLNKTFLRNFSFTEEIFDLKIVESKKSTVLMILTMKTTVGNEIKVLKLAKDENDWIQSETIIIGKNDITKSAFIETSRNQFLVVSSFNVAATSDSDFVTIFQLNPAEDKLIKYQRLVTGDKFDIMLSVDVALKKRKKTFLLLTRTGSRNLFIHWHNEASKKFVFQRKILFESEIVEIVVLYSDSPYFIVSLQTGDFCMFEWGGVESWKVKSCGHFTNINQIKSYEYLKRQHLFLTTLDAGTALTVHRQG